MSYRELIEASLQEITSKIESYNSDNNTNHKKCDYVEILALLSSDELYKDDLISRFFGEYTDRDDSAEEEQAEISDKHQQFITDLFFILKYRQRLFGRNYPFVITDDMVKLRDDVSIKNKLYIILLCCANLTTFERSLQYKLTDEFEHITYCAIQQYLPNLIVKKLGSNSDYTGNTRDKLRDLGNDINLPIYQDQIEGIPLRANKEKGVDLVAWYHFIDNIPNTLIFLIQCACGKDTRSKIYEPATYSTYFDFNKFQKDSIITLATPKVAITKEGYIENISQFTMRNSLYIDRLRLMQLIVDEACVSAIEAFQLADRLISERISVLD